MYSTQINIVAKKPKDGIGKICRKQLSYPNHTRSRYVEGGLRCQGKYKQSLPKKPLISVITVVYNDGETLTKTIESVLGQTYDNIEYIIIDGGSTDKTLDIIKAHEASIDYYISEPDDGIYSAMNKGLSLAQGNYIGLLNSGDWYETNALDIVSKNGQNYPGAIIAGTQRTLNKQYQLIGTRGLRFMDERVYLRMPLSHPATFVPCEIYEQIGNYADTSYSIIADWDFFIRCYEQKVEFSGVTDILTNYWRVGVSAQSDTSIFEEQVALLHTRFPSIRSYKLLFLLSSNMDEKPDNEIIKALRTHLNNGFVIPKKIMMGVYLYRKQEDKLSYSEWLETFDNSNLKCITEEYRLVQGYPTIEELIQKGQKKGLHEKEIWLINERGWDAKDNGFVFYAWLKTKHPEINSYYVITENSTDYTKVAELDYETIIEYGSEQHKLYYLFSKYVISSQGGDHCHPLSYEFLKTHYPSIFNSQFIFLQHGVLKNSIWYFHKGHFNSSLFVISGEMERKLFEERYQYTPDDIALTGLCRFDLLSYDKEHSHNEAAPYIFFMPTWRSWIKDEKDFLSSTYYKMLDELLKHPEFDKSLKKHGFRLKFFIHPNFSQYSKFLKSTSHSVEILAGDEDIGELIRRCSIMISDYSSAIIDAAYMDKPIIYYQPDIDEFRASHYSETCFFSYKEHGLGSVVTTLNPLLEEISEVLDSGCKNNDKYRERAKYILAHRDKGSCQRTFDAILKHKTLPMRLSQLYMSKRLTKMHPFQILAMDNILYIFLATDEKTGIIVQSFTIRFSLMNSEDKSQVINLPNSSLTFNVGEKLVYAFSIKIPNLTSLIDILGNSYVLPTPILGNYRSKHMSVAHLGFTIKGGAGTAALRLHKGLLASNVDSSLFQKERNHNSTPYGVHTFENDSNNAVTDWNNRENTYPGNTIFSISTPSHHEKHNFLSNFDILNFHWVAKYLSIETIAYLSHQKTPIVWTFHDINPLSGGCHYFHSCSNWKTNCSNCPQLKNNFDNLPSKVLVKKMESFNFKNITVVVLNEYFKHLVEQSPLFNESKIQIIPNSIDTKKFYPKNSESLYERLGLELKRKYILYVAAYSSTIKGYKEFENTISKYSNRYGIKNITIILAGSLPKNRNISLPLIEFGHVSEEKLIDLYNTAHVTVISSIEDNHPNIMLESISCGTPVVGFKVGGLPDVISNGRTGYTVELGDCDALADSINKVLIGADMSKNCREYAEQNLRLDIQATRYKNLYKELLADLPKKSSLADNIPEIFPETAVSLVRIQERMTSWQLQRLLALQSTSDKAMSAISSQIGVRIPARFNMPCFKKGWSYAEQWGRWTDGEEAVINLYLKDYQKSNTEAIFSVTHQTAINENFTVLINGDETEYEFKKGVLRFPVEIKEDTSLEIVFKFGQIKSPFEKGINSETRKLGIGVAWLQIINTPLASNEAINAKSLQVGDRVSAKINNSHFKKGWSSGESWGRWTEGEKAVIKLYLKNYQRGNNRAVFAVKHHLAINDNFTVIINGDKTKYEFKRGLLHFPVKIKEDNSLEIIFKFEQIKSPYEIERNAEMRKIGIGIVWFQIINPYVKTPYPPVTQSNKFNLL